MDEEKFSYNKDSDEWSCNQGNKIVRKRLKKRKSGREPYVYCFEEEKSMNCPIRKDCITPKTKVKASEVGINTIEFYKYSREQKEPEFKEKYKKRAGQKWKNGEMKNHYGLNRTRGHGLRDMFTQAELTAIAVNLKRIASILSSKPDSFLFIFRFELAF